MNRPIDELIRHSEAGAWLVAEGHGGTRPIAELFEHPEGLIYADTGWPEIGQHPFHVLRGTVEGQDPRWTVGNWVIRLVDPNRDSPERDALVRWSRWRAGPEGERYDRDLAYRIMRQSGLWN